MDTYFATIRIEKGLHLQLIYSNPMSPLLATLDTMEEIRNRVEPMMFENRIKSFFMYRGPFVDLCGPNGLKENKTRTTRVGLPNQAVVLLWKGDGIQIENNVLHLPSSTDRVIGGALLELPPGREFPSELQYICVADEYVRSGKRYGTIIFRGAKHLSRAFGCRSMELDSLNEAAPFYHSMGCRELVEESQFDMTRFQTALQRLITAPRRWMQRILHG